MTAKSFFYTLFALILGLTATTADAQENTEKAPAAKPKILVAYYSLSGNTKEIAKKIHEAVGGDLFEIQIDHTYPDNYHETTAQAKKEINANFRPKLKNTVADIAQYDVVFIGSPNWWGTITPAVSSFLEKTPLSGKKVIPFITHGRGGLQNTVTDLTAQCKGCSVSQTPWAGEGKDATGLAEWIKNVTPAEK